MEDDYTKTSTDTPIKKVDYYSNIMRQKSAFCKHVTLPPCTQAKFYVVTKNLCLILTDPNNFLWTGRRFPQPMGSTK